MIRTMPSVSDLLAVTPGFVAGVSPIPILRFAPGDLYMDETDNNGFRYVRNAESTTAIGAGRTAYWNATSSAGKSNASVFAGTAPLGPAGVALASIPAQGYGWIQVRGLCAATPAGLPGCNCNAVINPGAAVMAGPAAGNNGQLLTQTAGNPIVAVNQGVATAATAGQPLYLMFE